MDNMLISILFCLPVTIFAYQAGSSNTTLDVLSYHLFIEPDIKRGFIKGTEKIVFDAATDTVKLSCGDLIIDNVIGANVLGFRREGDQLIVFLSQRNSGMDAIEIEYHGNPKSGLVFDEEQGYAYTVFSTSQWMVCHTIPRDKATLDMDVLVPVGMQCIASGEQIGIREREGKMLFQWRQQYESPVYTFGFAIGDFKEESEKKGEVQLNYFSTDMGFAALEEVFQETGSMIGFFEDRSGIGYLQSSYSQILIGDHYQEMTGFAVLKDSYGRMVLEDSTETNLISHELAHQWWGNQITCESWRHFWLNEAFATFMSAAYNEYRFGVEKYDSDMTSYFQVYQDLKRRGNDKPLVFESWSKPSRDDRNIVYFKGAYVLHLLRKELGDEAFWKGIKFYSQRYFGKAVRTIDFKQAMEESSSKDLTSFFDEWIYKR